MNIAIADALTSVVKARRTVKPGAMNAQVIPNDTIETLLEMAHWAPTHAKTEPWRFFVYTGVGLQQFCLDHAEMYKNSVTEEQFMQNKYDGFLNQFKTVSHLVIAAMKRTPMAKIPMLEEYAAVSAAVQNILLTATAMDISSFWCTGGMALKPEMKNYLQLVEEDEVVAMIYLGKTDQDAKEGARNNDIASKTIWHK